MGQNTDDLLVELQRLIAKLEFINTTPERSRSLSLAITNLENAEDKLVRHIHTN